MLKSTEMFITWIQFEFSDRIKNQILSEVRLMSNNKMSPRFKKMLKC